GGGGCGAAGPGDRDDTHRRGIRVEWMALSRAGALYGTAAIAERRHVGSGSHLPGAAGRLCDLPDTRTGEACSRRARLPGVAAAAGRAEESLDPGSTVRRGAALAEATWSHLDEVSQRQGTGTVRARVQVAGAVILLAALVAAVFGSAFRSSLMPDD